MVIVQRLTGILRYSAFHSLAANVDLSQRLHNASRKNRPRV